jgi:hypothetical protein
LLVAIWVELFILTQHWNLCPDFQSKCWHVCELQKKMAQKIVVLVYNIHLLGHLISTTYCHLSLYWAASHQETKSP